MLFSMIAGVWDANLSARSARSSLEQDGAVSFDLRCGAARACGADRAGNHRAPRKAEQVADDQQSISQRISRPIAVDISTVVVADVPQSVGIQVIPVGIGSEQVVVAAVRLAIGIDVGCCRRKP